MPAIDIRRWISVLLERLAPSRQRQLVTLQGSRSWCDAQLRLLTELDPAMPVISNRELDSAAIPFSKADSCLGGEARLVLLDLFDGFNPDVLCIAGGLVRAGGVLVLLTPALEAWDLQSDRYALWQDGKHSASPVFAAYFFARMKLDPHIGILLTADTPPPEQPLLTPLQATPVTDGATAEQADILRRIESWALGGQPGIALISADRGRGKSTCLGLLAQRLYCRMRLLVCANSRRSAAALLRQEARLEFVAPDQLIRSCPAADLLIIDEAAMIPLSLLKQLSRIYPRLVMATTSGGYEGTGQGFMLRFVAELNAARLRRYSIEAPVRWCHGDCLESWLNRTLMLDLPGAEANALSGSIEGCEIRLLPGSAIADEMPLLGQAYALLNSAHYRTRPSDLRMLMENPDLLLVLALRQDQVIAVALLNIEGGLEARLCEEIFFGRRRPRGHLLAQMITAQAGVRHFAAYRGLRIQRIAVAPACRRQGLGTRLIEEAAGYGRKNAFDYLGASFALDAQSAAFWRHARFSLVHVSYAEGKSSGKQSIAVLRPLGQGLQPDIEVLRQRIQQQLPTWMTQFLQAMDAEQIAALLRYAGYRADIGEFEKQEVEAFARGNRGFELSFASLQRFVMQRVAQSSSPPDSLLIEKAVQNRDWDRLERESGNEGRRQLQQRLRGLVDALIKAC